MDRRQKKSREAIFKSFTVLLSKKHYNQITVREIIEYADVGRATFYAHFETKDFLLKEMCQELFCHIFDVASGTSSGRIYIFSCDASSDMLLHLLYHIKSNDANLRELLAGENNDVFLRYFKESLRQFILKQPKTFEKEKSKLVPSDFWINHISSTFVETVRWWVFGGLKESPEVLAEYLYAVLD